MSAGFVFCLLVASVLFWGGLVAAFVGARLPRHRQTAFVAAIGFWSLALVGLFI